MNKINFNFKNVKKLYNEIGLYNSKNEFYKGRDSKHQQILSYCTHILAAVNKLSSKREIVMVDCGCGKSYLSFVIYEYCTVVLKKKVKIIGIDTNAYASVIDNCKDSAKKQDKEIAFANYNSLTEMFKFKPALENLISVI